MGPLTHYCHIITKRFSVIITLMFLTHIIPLQKLNLNITGILPLLSPKYGCYLCICHGIIAVSIYKKFNLRYFLYKNIVPQVTRVKLNMLWNICHTHWNICFSKVRSVYRVTQRSVASLEQFVVQ